MKTKMFIFSRSFSSFCVCIFILNIVFVKNAPTDDSSKNVFAGSVQEFTNNLFQNVTKQYPGENVLISPVSTYAALLMVHLSAGEKTRNSLNDVMKISGKYENLSTLHENFGGVLHEIQHKVTNGGGEILSEAIIANGFFMQKDHPIIDSFIQSLKTYYNSSVTSLDFKEHAKEATETINSWISEATRSRINNFYKNPLEADTSAVLTSALFFSGKWKNPFPKVKTTHEKFNTTKAEIDVLMMDNHKRVNYRSSESLQFDSIELNYVGGKFSFIIILPRPSQSLKNLTDHWHLLNHDEFIQNARTELVHYKVPKMKFSWKKSLVDALQLKNEFGNADLSSMTTDPRVFISDLSQATEIELDEEGTIASAATVVEYSLRSGQVLFDNIEFFVTRPFMFSIRHISSNMELFSGVVYNPS